jgi:hypothetical protein
MSADDGGEMLRSEASETQHRCDFRVGGVSVRVSGQHGDDVVLVSALQAFIVEASASDVSLEVEWTERLGGQPGQKLFDSGSVWRLYEDGPDFRFDFRSPILGKQPYKRLWIDRQFRFARVQMSEECFAGTGYPVAPLEYPLDELLIMHRLTQEKAIELHSCGIVRADGTGNLFVGHSGAGKSTTTRLWTEREDVEILSDDRIIVRRDEGESFVETPRDAAASAEGKGILRLRDRSALPIGRSAQDDRAKSKHSAQDDKLKTKRSAQDDSARTNSFAQDDKKRSGMRMYGTPWHGEAMYASPGSAPLSRIFILEHGHGNVVTRLSPSQAVAELFARSFVPFHRHEYVDSALEFLQELVGAVPVYHYAFEPTAAAVERILEFRD